MFFFNVPGTLRTPLCALRENVKTTNIFLENDDTFGEDLENGCVLKIHKLVMFSSLLRMRFLFALGWKRNEHEHQVGS